MESISLLPEAGISGSLEETDFQLVAGVINKIAAASLTTAGYHGQVEVYTETVSLFAELRPQMYHVDFSTHTTTEISFFHAE